ncbi:7084_t:CDS:2 [Ambispora leptoticha]|uniref:7084_t:CDS:1 n=1 Tax=Ambispora leptoticha TaxID=144679 RepID=A0A9N9A1V6_9GLOM|nr:7084_t:CDS:2 [Ambispora leptoticha]
MVILLLPSTIPNYYGSISMQRGPKCNSTTSARFRELNHTTFYKATNPEYKTATESNQALINDADEEETSAPVLTIGIGDTITQEVNFQITQDQSTLSQEIAKFLPSKT